MDTTEARAEMRKPSALAIADAAFQFPATTMKPEDHPRYVAYDEIQELKRGKARTRWRVSTMLLTSGESFETMLFDHEGHEEWAGETAYRASALMNHALVLAAVVNGSRLPDQPLPGRIKRRRPKF